MARRLSKSRYTLFCQCEKALWLRVNKPEEAIVDAGLEARFEQGNEVGDLAMGLFGNYVEVTAEREDGSLDLESMVEKTKQEMKKGTETICEASFTFENNYCAVDILRKTDNGWDSNRFAESTKYYHRTIQQTLMRSIVAIIKMVGSNTYDYDLRNKSSHELCKRIVESGLLDEVSLPMV